MKISLEWASEFVQLPPGTTAKEVARELTLKTVEVDDCIDTAAALANVVVGRVVELKPLEDKACSQMLCDIGCGQQVLVVSRASNVREGSMVAVALPGARLTTRGSDVGTRTVTPAQMFGVKSQGVICTATALGLQRLFPQSKADEAIDLMELDAQVGETLADAIQFNDFVLEIDNKSLTNRPDLWGHYGIARELATIFGRELKPLPEVAPIPDVKRLVGIVDRDLCRRLTVVEFGLDETESTPLWLRSRLARIDEWTVNPAVDISNYVMFTVGQPTHVYDLDQVTLPLSVGRSEATTKLELVTSESRELEPGTPVIRDSNGTVAIAGIMGAAHSGVSAGSRRFALEVATFRPEPIRRAAQRLALRTEASARFEKGLDTPRVNTAVSVFLNVLADVAPGASVVAMQDVHLDPTPPTNVDLNLDFLATRIGQRIEISEVRAILQSLGFTVAVDANHLCITVPTWRSTGDVSLPQDIVEEVARIHGYDSMPATVPSIKLTPVRQLNRQSLDRTIREQLAARAGMQEVVTYPWVADSMLAAVGLEKEKTLRFEGAPAPDRDSLRPSLIPNLLEAVATNLRYRQSFSLFEAGTIFVSGGPYAPFHGIFEPLPRLESMIAASIVGTDGATLFRQAKGSIEMLRRYCHLTDLQFADACEAPWADKIARVSMIAKGTKVGALGLLTTRCRRLAGIEDVQVACFEINIDGLSTYPSRENRYEPIPELPVSEFDLSVVVCDDISWDLISSTILDDVNELIRDVSFVTEFRGTWVPEGRKSVTVRITLQPTATTLTAVQINEVRSSVLDVLEQRLDAYLRN